MKRFVIQLCSAIACNAYVQGFFKKTIYRGNLKHVCIPGLNCYSCPGATGACPIGSLQAVYSSKGNFFSYYVLGFLMAFGILFGRLACGYLCPFGFLQDLLYKIKTKKITLKKKIDKIFRWLKYIILLVFVIILPLFLVGENGLSSPYFCKYICPAGTLEGGIPLVLFNDGLRAMIGPLFFWKMGLLITVIVMSIFLYRFFCKYLCPLGALYSLFNKYSFYKMEIDNDKCTKCGICVNACKMGIDVYNDPNNRECIRCDVCKKACPHNAISTKMKF